MVQYSHFAIVNYILVDHIAVTMLSFAVVYEGTAAPEHVDYRSMVI